MDPGRGSAGYDVDFSCPDATTVVENDKALALWPHCAVSAVDEEPKLMTALHSGKGSFDCDEEARAGRLRRSHNLSGRWIGYSEANNARVAEHAEEEIERRWD